ncbi:MAG TPA: serine/threonine-protein kinase, partial [Pirellulales bacterium]|nr:serine/threonine-protein kinase [Pirellulales bacterium]
MSDTPHDHTSREARVDNVIASHLQAMERGEARDWRTYLARHPDIARELSLFFADQAEFQRAAGKWLSGTAEFRDTPQNVENTPPPKVAPSTWNAQEGPAGDAPAGADRFGDYELLEEIARGGMGVVYKARQVNLDRLVAVKMILGGQLASAAEVRRFQTEAEAAANLDHPNIVPIFEVGQHDGRHYFSMGFVEGQSLAARVAAGPLPPREAAELVRKVSAAVEYAHQRGVIHRDLKPANILLDQQGQPRVTDFGLAKRVDRDSNMTGNHILGTPSYMPPEQASGLGERIGAASDVYSLGAVLYCLLTGRPPFQAANPLDTLRHVLDRAPLPARLLNPGIPLDLDTIALKCLEKTPERRYATARELTDELDRFLAGAPIRARPVGQVERGWRWCRRNRTVAALSAAVMVSLFAGLGGSVWQAVRAVHERDLKQQALEVAKANEKKAVTEKQVAQAVRGFLQHDLLRQADATEQADSLRHLGGRFKATENPTIKELLDRAAAELTPEKIDSNFPDQPEVQASILLTVGNTYRGIGHYQQAVEFLLRASQIFRETLGADHADALASLDGLGLAYLLDGKLPEAIELFEQILAARAKNPSDDQKETLATLNKLAYAHSLAGHLPEAIDLFEQARDAKRKEVGVEDRQMLVILNNLALAYQAAGRCREAIQLFEQVRNDEIKTLGAQDPDTLTTLDNLAGAYLEVGRLPDAIALFEQVRTGRVAVRGPDHPETLNTLNNLALAYQSAGRLAEAIELFEQVRKDTIDAFGPNHVETLVTLNNLAQAYQDLGRLPEAIELLQQIRDALAQTPSASRLRSLT